MPVFSQDSKNSEENSFFEHVARGKVKESIELLDNNPGLINAVDPSGESALTLASLMGHKELVEILLKRGAKIDQTQNGRTALHKAMFKGSVDQIRLLVNWGADPLAMDDDSDSVLSTGVFAGNVDGVGYLASIIPNFGKEVDACHCLFIAIRNNDKKMLKLLLANGANPNVRNATEATPLIDAVNGREELLDILIRAGADMSLRDVMGHTAIEWARVLDEKNAFNILKKHQEGGLVD